MLVAGMAAGSCTNHGRKATAPPALVEKPGPLPPGPTSPGITVPDGTHQVSPSATVTADGTDPTVCVRALSAAGPRPYTGGIRILATATFGLVRWLMCTPQGTDDDGVVSARTADGVHWSVTVLAGAPFHAGDAVDAHIEDKDRAWITDDVLVGPFHVHGWTENGGATWTFIGPDPTH
jgi:hypothetical protein